MNRQRVRCRGILGVIFGVVACHDFSLPEPGQAASGAAGGTRGTTAQPAAGNPSWNMPDERVKGGTLGSSDTFPQTVGVSASGVTGSGGSLQSAATTSLPTEKALGGGGAWTGALATAVDDRDTGSKGGAVHDSGGGTTLRAGGSGDTVAPTDRGTTPGAGGSGGALAHTGTATDSAVGYGSTNATSLTSNTGGAITSQSSVGGETSVSGTSSGGATTTRLTTSTAPSTNVPPRKHQSDYRLLTDVPGTYGGDGICYYSAPRVDGDNVTWCTPQTGAQTDCDGNVPEHHDLLDLRHRVQLAILDTWQRMSNLEIFDWVDCPVKEATGKSHDDSIKQWLAIAFASVDRAERVGPSYTGPSVVYVDWRKIANDDYSGMLHEFGHLLGYADDWLRPDYRVPDGCALPEDHPRLGFGTQETFYDPEAIMGPCFDRQSRALLSAGDVALTQAAYGRRFDGALVGYPGQCLVAFGDTARQWPCRGEPTDMWRWDAATSTLSVTPKVGDATSTRCLNPSGGVLNPTLPTNVVLQVCDGRAAETMALANTQWRAFGTQCIEASASGLTNRTCSSAATQFWRIWDGDPNDTLDSAQIQLLGTNQCVTSRGLPIDAGTLLSLAPCDANDSAQLFEYPGSGRIVQGSQCVSIPSNVAELGLPLVLSQACGSHIPFGAKFHWTTEIRHADQCLTWTVNLAVPAIARFSVCTSWGTLPQQSWDFYF